METEVKILSGSASRYLAGKIADSHGKPLTNVTVQQFSDGEFQPYINESVRGAFVFIIQSTFAPSNNLMEMLLTIDAAKRASADYITAVVPYFGLARQDRKDKPRTSIGAKLVANLISAAGASRIMTMDLHAPQIQGFFDIPVDHLDSSAVFIPYIQSLKLDNLIFASPDVGGSKRTRAYAQHFQTDFVICDKHRLRANEIAEMQIIGNVEGKDVILIDDIVDTANTLCNAAKLMIEKGANTVRAVCTHPILSGKAYENIKNSALEELTVCNTIPLKEDIAHDKIKVISVEDIFATAIKHTYEHKSISSLFIDTYN